MTIYLASGNAHKKEEFASILPHHTLMIPSEKGIPFNPDETGSTFLENALIKAQALYELVQAPVIADDSGLCIDALDGKPGIYSARYGSSNGIELSAQEKNALVLEQMKGKQERSCRFICCIVCMLDKNRVYTIQESFEGEIAEEPQGEKGFGYDPIVYVPSLKRTVAELTADEKNRFSHRGKAGTVLARLLSSLEEN